MAVKYKYFTPNQTYFITFTILGWKKIFTNKKYCDLIYKWFDYMRQNYGNKIYGYVIMPNHIHALIYREFQYCTVGGNQVSTLGNLVSTNLPFLCTMRPKGLIYITDKSPKLSIFIANAKRFLAYQIIAFLEQDDKKEILEYFKKHARKKEEAKHKVFEDKYDALVIQSEKFFLEKLKYIHNNPLAKHWRLANSIVEYKYSSAANYETGSGHYEIDIVEF